MHIRSTYKIERVYKTGTVKTDEASSYDEAKQEMEHALDTATNKLEGVRIVRIDETVVAYRHTNPVRFPIAGERTK